MKWFIIKDFYFSFIVIYQEVSSILWITKACSLLFSNTWYGYVLSFQNRDNFCKAFAYTLPQKCFGWVETSQPKWQKCSFKICFKPELTASFFLPFIIQCQISETSRVWIIISSLIKNVGWFFSTSMNFVKHHIFIFC